MATTMTLGQLMIASRQRADMLPAGYTPTLTATNLFVTDPEIISYINQSAFELYDLLIQTYGNDYYVATPFQLVTNGSNQLYPLPPDFYKLLGVDLAITTVPNSFITLKPFTFSDRNRYASPNFQSLAGVTNMRYRLQGDDLWLTPIPQGGTTIQLWYIPRLTTLAALSDTLDGVSGWTEYVITDVAIKCAQKEESDVSILAAQKLALITRIQSAAENRDAANPATVADVQVMGYDEMMGHGFGGWY